VPQPVREKAVSSARQLLGAISTRRTQIVGGSEGLLRVLRELVATNDAKVASLVPLLALSVPDNERLVPVLWRCLSIVDRAARHYEAERLIARLLVMAMDPDLFAILEAEPKLGHAGIDRQALRRAYPFEDALPRDSNLVVLLARADALQAEPSRTNAFLDAKKAGSKYFATLERDNKRTFRFNLRWLGTLTSAVTSLAAATIITWIAIARPHSFLEPHGGWNILLMAAPTALGIGISLLMDKPLKKEPLYFSNSHTHWIERLGATDGLEGIWELFFIPIAISVGCCDLLHHSVYLYIGVAALANVVGNLLPMTHIFDEKKIYVLNKRNPHVDAYTDPASAHWLRKPPTDPDKP
jgi:hypothetical protein